MKTRQLPRALSATILAVVLATTAAACSNDNDPSSSTSNSGATTADGGSGGAALPDDVNDADVEFVQGMIPHHEQAIEMSEMVIADGEDPTVLTLAEQINAAQGPEIDQMNTWLDDWGIEPTGSHDMDGMDGMMSGDEMNAMSETMGAELDRMFLEMMIRHHEGAIQMAEIALDEGANADVLALAQAIIDGQQAEIEQMESMLDDA